MIGMNAKRKARIVVKVARFKNAVRFGLRICELDSPYLLRPGISAINRKSNGQIDFIGTRGRLNASDSIFVLSGKSDIVAR